MYGRSAGWLAVSYSDRGGGSACVRGASAGAKERKRRLRFIFLIVEENAQRT